MLKWFSAWRFVFIIRCYPLLFIIFGSFSSKYASASFTNMLRKRAFMLNDTTSSSFEIVSVFQSFSESAAVFLIVRFPVGIPSSLDFCISHRAIVCVSGLVAAMISYISLYDLCSPQFRLLKVPIDTK